ncbi:MAG: 30S ribosomal protein S6 [Deltaproteobacteria bacterium]|nr:30S ribosomal protein S6 [Deltaproteobacteria bacterium]
MNNNYEVVFIARPDAGDDIIKGIIQKAKDAAGSLNSQITKVEEWGKRRMVYPIRKHLDGYYVLLNLSANPSACKEVERILRLNEDVIRYQTIKKIEVKNTKKAKNKKEAKESKEINP